MNTRFSSRAFTLIEILVVVAIIGILASVIIVNISSSKSKTSDATVKEELHQLWTQIDTTYGDTGAYSTNFVSATCPTTSSPPDPIFYSDVSVRSLISKLNSINGNNTKCASGSSSGATADSWAIASPLPSVGTGGQWWCVDSSGQKKLSYETYNAGDEFLGLFIPVAYAVGAPPGPNLGGGAGTAAKCP